MADSSVGKTFSIGWLTGRVQAASQDSALVALEIVSSSGFNRTSKGTLAVIFGVNSPWRAHILLAISEEYHKPGVLDVSREASFNTL